MSTYLVGTYTADMDGSAEGILALRSAPDGSLQLTGVAAVAASPSFLALDGDTVYAVAEGAGRVAEYTLSGTDLTLVSEASSGGEAPCHIGVYGSTVVVANYVDGALGVLSATPLTLAQTLDATGSGPHDAQDGAHAHCSFAVDATTVLSADLGADRLHVHTLAEGKLERTDSIELPPGTGPRDIVAHASGALLILAELGNRLLLARWNDGLEVLSTVDLPGAAAGDHAAGISLSTDGRFAYVTLRGSNRISVLAIEGDALTAVGSVSSAGDWPRHHVIDGDLLHVANQLSSTVATFRIGDDGIPQHLATTAVPSPTYLLRVSS